MKKKLTLHKLAIAVALLVFAFGIAVSKPQDAHSQGLPSSNFDNALKEYQLSIEAYTSAHDDYELARTNYLKFGTLTSQNEAREATRVMLEARDQVMIEYLEAVEARIDEGSGIDQSTKDRLTAALNDEVQWFTSHKNSLVGAGSLDDLVADSNEARDRFNTLGPIIYESLSFIPYGRVDRFHDRLNSNFLAAREKVSLIRSETRPEYQFDVDKLERIDGWLFQTEERILRSDEKIATALTIVESIPNQGKGRSISDSKKRYDNLIGNLGNTLQDLKDASLYMKEIIREIKTK